MELHGRITNRILVVDDEPQLRALVRLYLEKDGFSIDEACDGREGLEHAERDLYRLIILDLMMPGMDGWEVCRSIRRMTDVPILILTARGEIEDRVVGLDIGADDYLVKPFDARELVARVHALLRRSGPGLPKPVLHYGDLRLDPAARQVTVGERPVSLSPKEFDLIYFLARNPGQVFSREQLLRQVWNDEYIGETRTVDSHIKNLRDKLGGVGGDRDWLATVWGIGYKFEAVNN